MDSSYPTSHSIALALSIVLTASAQTLLKLGATRSSSALASLINPWTVTGYALFGLVTVLSVYAMQEIQLKVVTAWTGATYVLVMLSSKLFLGEPLTGTSVLGVALIAFGVAVFHS